MPESTRESSKSPATGRFTTRRPCSSLRLGIAQVHPKLGNLPANLDNLAAFVEQAVAANVDLLVFPELAITGYPAGPWYSSASIGPFSPEFARLKELSHRVPLIVGLIEETENIEFFNSAVYLSAGRVQHLHRKIYLPNYRHFDERRYFKAGRSVSAFETPWCRMGMLICGDCWHISLPYLLAHDGADVIVVLAASAMMGMTEAISTRDAWERMNRCYALTLSSFVVFANLVGETDGIRCWGSSHVVIPDGQILNQAGSDQEELLVTTLDLNQLRQQRLILPFRRDDSLSLTTELGREVLLRKNRRANGLSGAHPSPPIEDSAAEPRITSAEISDLAFGDSDHPDSRSEI